MKQNLNQVTVRLSGGGAYHQGRVELNVNGLWGTVADPEWDNKDGDVVCRMLGLPPASGTPRGAIFGQGTGIVWLSHVDCLGDETSIIDCGNYGGWGTGRLYSYNEHAHDAGVICGEPDGKLYSAGKLTVLRIGDCRVPTISKDDDKKRSPSLLVLTSACYF